MNDELFAIIGLGIIAFFVVKSNTSQNINTVQSNSTSPDVTTPNGSGDLPPVSGNVNCPGSPGCPGGSAFIGSIDDYLYYSQS